MSFEIRSTVLNLGKNILNSHKLLVKSTFTFWNKMEMNNQACFVCKHSINFFIYKVKYSFILKSKQSKILIK